MQPADAILKFAAQHGLSDEATLELSVLVGQATLVPDDFSISHDSHGDATLPPAGPTASGPTAPARVVATAASTSMAQRYTDLGELGSGGMGEVRRVRDAHLNRIVAMKIAKPTVMVTPQARRRFLDEARATAQLAHPGIVPVHDVGLLPDGRAYFTMKEVRGHTLADVIREVHAACTPARWGAWGEWTLRRLIDAFHKICDAVAYAHSRGVVHRDIKPNNVMIGAFGEVLLLDWGIAKVLGRGTRDGAVEPVVTERSAHGNRTRVGSVTGTPRFMAPEQARGEVDELGPTADVYSLGATLAKILGLGAFTPDPPLPPPPPGLVAVVERATREVAAERFADANALTVEVAAWLDGARRRSDAAELVAEADAGVGRIAALRRSADQLHAEGEADLAAIPPWQASDQKVPAWRKMDHAARLRSEAAVLEVEWTQTLESALRVWPDCADAHDRLAAHYRVLHAAAEQTGDRHAPAPFEALLRAHDTGLYTAYLEGDGAVTLITDPPADVRWLRVDEVDRQFVESPVPGPARTPVRAHALARGRYVVELSAPGCDTVRYPIRVDRQRHADGVPPDGQASWPIRLPRVGELDADDVYVPAGWMVLGGDTNAFGGGPRTEAWVPALVIRRYPVTVGEFLAFLNDLVGRGEDAAADRWLPRERAAEGTRGAALFARTADGYTIVPDADGDVLDLQWPAIFVDYASARAYAEWYSARRGQTWRLPGEVEWEKAARGVDGRACPWGDMVEPSWFCNNASVAGRPLPARVTAYPLDVSVYGVRCMAGAANEWTLGGYEAPLVDPDGRAIPSRAPDDDVLICIRGGSWNSPPGIGRSASRVGYRRGARFAGLSFRLARSLA